MPSGSVAAGRCSSEGIPALPSDAPCGSAVAVPRLPLRLAAAAAAPGRCVPHPALRGCSAFIAVPGVLLFPVPPAGEQEGPSSAAWGAQGRAVRPLPG